MLPYSSEAKGVQPKIHLQPSVKHIAMEWQ